MVHCVYLALSIKAVKHWMRACMHKHTQINVETHMRNAQIFSSVYTHTVAAQTHAHSLEHTGGPGFPLGPVGPGAPAAP